MSSACTSKSLDEVTVSTASNPHARHSQVAEVHAAALEQDASVFDYDGVFDSMQEAKVAPVSPP